jgi:CMP-N-acetylneuraminic acid synthetase
MRSGSERIPGKNLADLGGRPLYKWVLDALRDCAAVDDIRVFCDDCAGIPEAEPLPLEVANGSMNDAIAWIIERVPSDIYLQTHATNPFVFSYHFTEAIDRFRSQHHHDSLLSVGPLQRKRFWTPDRRPVNHQPYTLIPTQELMGLHEENSCIYLFTRESFAYARNRIGKRPMLYVMPETLDIDWPWDLEKARHMVGGCGKCQC